MGRIRSIKPELPQSPTLGRVPREARLCFILLWTIADDSGRACGNSRLLASLLYPYDVDAIDHIDGWLARLEQVGAIRRYEVGGEQYLDIPGFGKHQKIDKPSAPKYPEFVEPSRVVAEPSKFLTPGWEGIGGDGKGREGFPPEPVGSSDVVVVPLLADGPTSKAVRARGAAQRIFDYWREVTKHDAAKLTDKRQRLIELRLKDGYTEPQIRAAIDGCKSSAFHQGQNDRAAVFDDIELICRSGEKLEAFIQQGERKVDPLMSALSLAGRQAVEILRDWHVPEDRNAAD